MGTRCNIEIVRTTRYNQFSDFDKRSKMLYRHWDGYPEGTAADWLFVADLWAMNTGHAENFDDILSLVNSIHINREFTLDRFCYSGITKYQYTDGLHGDIEYFYRLELLKILLPEKDEHNRNQYNHISLLTCHERDWNDNSWTADNDNLLFRYTVDSSVLLELHENPLQLIEDYFHSTGIRGVYHEILSILQTTTHYPSYTSKIGDMCDEVVMSALKYKAQEQAMIYIQNSQEQNSNT